MKYLIAILACFCFLITTVDATHFRGISIFYENIGGDTIRIHEYEYLECASTTTLPSSYQVLIAGIGSGCILPDTIPNSLGYTSVEVTPVCPSIQTSCQSSSATLPGVLERHHWMDFDTSPMNCNEYTFSFSHCCRNGGITTVVNPFTQSIYGEANVFLSSIQAGNSSPVWNSLPVIMVYGTTDSFVFDQGAFDADGDSLVYFLAPAYSSQGVILPYQAGFSPTQPLGPSWNVVLDSTCGLLTLQPNPGSLQVGPIAIVLEEYRNGVLIGRHSREVTAIITSSLLVAPNASHDGLSNATSGGQIFGDTLLVPSYSAFCVDIGSQSSLVGDSLALGICFSDTGYSWRDTNGVDIARVEAEDPIGEFCWMAPYWGSFGLTAWIEEGGCVANKLQLRDYTIIVGDTGLVWPGDANDDLIANNLDLLALGLAYGNTGSARNSASNTWVGQMSFPWLDTISGGIDMKHQDCNGDGTVGMDDTLAITLNYGLTHNKSHGSNGGPNDPPLTLVIPGDSASVGDTIYADIFLGDMAFPANNVYGIAFSINYDPTLIDSNSFKITFDNNWMGTNPNQMELSYNWFDQAICDAAYVRTDQQNTSGFGRIGTASFIIIDNIDGKKETLVTDTLVLGFQNVTLIGLDNVGIPVNAQGDEMIVFDNSVEVVAPMASDVVLYPNPAAGWLFVEASAEINSLELINLEGQRVYKMEAAGNRQRIAIGDLASGLYILKVETSLGFNYKKVVIKDN